MSDWKHGMCCNCSDPTTCLMGWCCPCILAWQTSKEFEQEAYWGLIHCWLYPFTVPVLRNQIRETKGIDGSLLGDVVCGWCCPTCTSIQMHRELTD